MRPLITVPLVMVGILAIVGAAPAQAPIAGVSGDDLATGPYARMHMLLEKTIFSVDVLTVDIRVDESTQREFARIAKGRAYSESLADQVARAAVAAENVFAVLRFERNVSLSRWVQGVREALEKAHHWGVIDRELYRHTSDRLPEWFSAIAQRGFRTGDRIVYRTWPDRMRTMLVGADGKVFVDQTDAGSGPRRALLGGYFAPGTDFREPLIRSLISSARDGAGWATPMPTDRSRLTGSVADRPRRAPNGFWPALNGGEPAALYGVVFLLIAAAGSGV